MATSTMPIPKKKKLLVETETVPPKEHIVKSATGRIFKITIEDDDQKGGANKVYKGPRGGKYIIVDGKKKYIKQ